MQGAEDEPFQATTPSGPTATPTDGAADRHADPTAAPTATPRHAAGGRHAVVAVGPGGTLTFRDADSQQHVHDPGRRHDPLGVGRGHAALVDFRPLLSGDGTWNSGIQITGSFEHTFNSQGTFPYFCIPHGQAMTGTVIVNP